MSEKKEKKKKTTKKKAENAKKSSKDQIAELNDKHLRLFAEFENFKKRTAKERIELYKTAGENVLSAIIPILDDFERSIKAKSDAGEKLEDDQGVNLIYNKLKSTLESKGLKEIENPIGQELNTDFHEAITNIPAPSEDMKGKIIDVIEKGYFLNEKVIRYAKVVVANN
jgi:molecular chaperone GrpE